MSVAIDYTSGAFAANKAQSVGTIAAATGTYNLGVAAYDGVSFSVATEETAIQGIFFKPDGTKLYLTGISGLDVNEYILSSAWDISTASYVQNFSVSGQETLPRALFFKPDGTKMYVLGTSGDDVNEYNLSTAWDISTASYVQVFSVRTQEGFPTAFWFKPDGTKMYAVGTANDTVFEYDLSTAWDVSTASYNSVSFSVNSQDAAPVSLVFNPEGTGMYMLGSTGVDVNEYSLSTAWDVSSASYVQNFSVATQDASPTSLFFGAGGTKMYIAGNGTDTIYQYSTGSDTTLDVSSGQYFEFTPTADTTFAFSNAPASGTAAGFALAVTGADVTAGYDLANASYDSVSFSISGQETSPRDVEFSSDGTKMYIIGNSSDSVQQYTLSTAFDLSTASYDSVSFSIASQDSTSYGVTFNNDGTKMYVLGTSTTTVYQYTLSTAFNVSTASYDSVSFSVTSQDNTPVGIDFNNDGTKMYMVGIANDSVYQYTLSTAFDLSTASYDSVSFSVASQSVSPLSVNFSNDGTKMYVLGSDNDTVFQYTLSTAFDLSTASYDSVSFSVTSQDNSPYGLSFNNDGTKMYMVGITNDTIYQYSTTSSAAATFTYPASVDWPSGTAPDAPAVGETDVLVFYTEDGGTTYYGFQAGDAMA